MWWTCPANFGRRRRIVKYISMSDTLADESRSFRGGFSFSEGIWGIYCHLLPPRARSFLILFISLALSSHTVLDPAGCVLFVFPSFILLTAFVHHVLCYFCPLSVLFHSPVWLQTVAQESVVGLTSHPRRLSPSPRACLVSRGADESLCGRISACCATCQLRRSASHYSLGMRMWDLLRDVKEVFHPINHPGIHLHTWQPRLDV